MVPITELSKESEQMKIKKNFFHIFLNPPYISKQRTLTFLLVSIFSAFPALHSR